MRGALFTRAQCSDYEDTPRGKASVLVRQDSCSIDHYGHIQYTLGYGPGHKGNEIVITPKEFQSFWRRVNEFTSSSMSGVHYGHYKEAIQDEVSTKVLAQQLTVIARSGIPLRTGVLACK